MDDLTGQSMTVDFMHNKGEIKADSLNVNQLVFTTPVRTPKQLFMAAFAATAGVAAAIGTFVLITSTIGFIAGFIDGLFGG